MESATLIIDRLDRWLAEHRPEYYACLRPGLTDLQLDTLERLVGYKFPSAFRAFYRWRDGQDPEGEPFIFNRTFMSFEDVRCTWELMTEMQEGGEWDEPQWWCRGWLPFLENGAGSHLCLDLHGSFTGKKGQIVEFWNRAWDRPVVAESFQSWLEWFVASLEAGLWLLNPESGNFEPVNSTDRIGGGPLHPDKVIRGDARVPP
jgi:cell wall assembly regulator SMI1